MPCLFSIIRGLHPRNVCLSMAMIYTHAMLLFHCSRLISTQCSLFIGYGLHAHNDYFPLFIPYIHAFLISGIILLILSTGGCICQQHPPGSSQVKLISDNSKCFLCFVAQLFRFYGGSIHVGYLMPKPALIFIKFIRF